MIFRKLNPIINQIKIKNLTDSKIPLQQQISTFQNAVQSYLYQKSRKENEKISQHTIFEQLQEIYLKQLQKTIFGLILLQTCLFALENQCCHQKIKFLYYYAHQMFARNQIAKAQGCLLEAFHNNLKVKKKIKEGFKSGLDFVKMKGSIQEKEQILDNLIVVIQECLSFNDRINMLLKKPSDSNIKYQKLRTPIYRQKDKSIIHIMQEETNIEKMPKIQKYEVQLLLFEAYFLCSNISEIATKRLFYQKCKEYLKQKMKKAYPLYNVEKDIISIEFNQDKCFYNLQREKNKNNKIQKIFNDKINIRKKIYTHFQKPKPIKVDLESKFVKEKMNKENKLFQNEDKSSKKLFRMKKIKSAYENSKGKFNNFRRVQKETKQIVIQQIEKQLTKQEKKLEMVVQNLIETNGDTLNQENIIDQKERILQTNRENMISVTQTFNPNSFIVPRISIELNASQNQNKINQINKFQYSQAILQKWCSEQRLGNQILKMMEESNQQIIKRSIQNEITQDQQNAINPKNVENFLQKIENYEQVYFRQQQDLQLNKEQNIPIFQSSIEENTLRDQLKQWIQNLNFYIEIAQAQRIQLTIQQKSKQIQSIQKEEIEGLLNCYYQMLNEQKVQKASLLCKEMSLKEQKQLICSLISEETIDYLNSVFQSVSVIDYKRIDSKISNKQLNQSQQILIKILPSNTNYKQQYQFPIVIKQSNQKQYTIKMEKQVDRISIWMNGVKALLIDTIQNINWQHILNAENMEVYNGYLLIHNVWIKTDKIVIKYQQNNKSATLILQVYEQSYRLNNQICFKFQARQMITANIFLFQATGLQCRNKIRNSLKDVIGYSLTFSQPNGIKFNLKHCQQFIKLL